MQIRSTTSLDHEAFITACHAARLSPPAELLRFYLDRPDIMTYVAEENGRIIGTGAATNYGNATGWFGVVSVLPEWQGQGIGHALMEWGENVLRQKGIETFVLLATPRGRPLYEKLGFKAGTDYIALKGPGLASPIDDRRIRPLAPADWAAIEALDFSATGERRSAMLHAMRSGYVVADQSDRLRGYHLPAPWGGGPAIALDPEAGFLLIDLVRRLHGQEPVIVRLPEVNHAGVRSLLSAGFTETARCTFMVKGAWPEPYRPDRIWGVFSFALG